MNLPRPVPPAEAGARLIGGWIGPDGRYWPAEVGEHLAVGLLLSRAGLAPRELGKIPRRLWVAVHANGDIVGFELTQAHRDALLDVLRAVPDTARGSRWRQRIADALRRGEQLAEGRDWSDRSEALRWIEHAGRASKALQSMRAAAR